jgi:hypothetical protein
MFDEFDEAEAVRTVVDAVRYFQESPFVSGGGKIELPSAEADQVGAMMLDLAQHWSGIEGVIVGMFMMADAAEDRLRLMMHEMDDDCEDCAADLNAIAPFLNLLLQFPRAIVEYIGSGLSANETAAARELFDELGLEAPESEEE